MLAGTASTPPEYEPCPNFAMGSTWLVWQSHFHDTTEVCRAERNRQGQTLRQLLRRQCPPLLQLQATCTWLFKFGSQHDMLTWQHPSIVVGRDYEDTLEEIVVAVAII